MLVKNTYINNINKIASQTSTNSKENDIKSKNEFQTVFEEQLGKYADIKFSKHAESRLKERNIRITDIQKGKLLNSIQKAEDKGIRDSLILLDNIAFIVNIKNRTVITAANNNDLNDSVFTNIDGVVFA